MNRVISGKFVGKKIKIVNLEVSIKLKRRSYLTLNEKSVRYIKVINIESKKNFLNTYLRSEFTKNLSDSFRLTSIITAKEDYTFLCKVEYISGEVSVIELNKDMYVHLGKLI